MFVVILSKSIRKKDQESQNFSGDDSRTPLNDSGNNNSKRRDDEAYNLQLESKEISMFLKTAITPISSVEMNKEKDFY